MARIVRMPYVYHDKVNRRHYMERRVPTDVIAILGLTGKDTKVKHIFRQEVDRATADFLSVQINAEWEAQWQAVRPQPPRIPYFSIADALIHQQELVDATRKVMAMVEAGEVTIPTADELRQIRREVDAEVAAEDGVEFVATPLAVPTMKPAEATVSLDQAIADWKKKHGAWPQTEAGRRAEKKAEAAKRRAAASLFASAGTEDMAAIDTRTIQKWCDGLDGRVAYDYVSNVKTLYRRLKKSNRFAAGMADPAADIETPPKPQHQGRDQFAPTRAAMILEDAAVSPDPLIRWGHPIMAYTGAIVSEMVYAPASEIKKMYGVWVWHVGEKRTLKTNNRPRVIPIHQRLIDAGFLDFVRSRGDGLLFDTDNDNASAALLAHLRGLGIPKTRDQVNYSWRHGFISRLVNNGVDPTLRRYLDGHGLGHIDEKHYIHHHMKNMVEAIRSVDPTAPYAEIVVGEAA